MSRSRRRSRLRPMASAAVLTLVLAACGGGDPVIEEEPAATPTEAPTEDPEPDDEPEEPTEDEPAEDEPTEAPEPPPATEEPSAGPTPDPARLDDPCGPHAGREAEGFIEVVSPVDGQRPAGGSVELVGCSNVHEATVSWTLYDGDGRELDTGFTTAECGSGCVGAFADTVPLDAAAPEPFAELHVYSEDASGAEDFLFLTAIPLVLD